MPKFTDSPYFLIRDFFSQLLNSTATAAERDPVFLEVYFMDEEIYLNTDGFISYTEPYDIDVMVDNDVLWNVSGDDAQEAYVITSDGGAILRGKETIVVEGEHIELFTQDQTSDQFVKVKLFPADDITEEYNSNEFNFVPFDDTFINDDGTVFDVITSDPGNPDVTYYEELFNDYTKTTEFVNSTSIVAGEDMYFRENSQFQTWLKEQAEAYLLDKTTLNFIVRNYVNTDKPFLRFGDVYIDNSGASDVYKIHFYGFKDWTVNALPYSNRTPKFSEFLQVFFDEVYSQGYQLLKDIWSLRDADECDEMYLPLIAKFNGVDEDLINIEDVELYRIYIRQLTSLLEKKGTHSALKSIYKTMSSNSDNRFNYYERWHNFGAEGGNGIIDDGEYTDYLIDEAYGDPLTGSGLRVDVDTIDYRAVRTVDITNPGTNYTVSRTGVAAGLITSGSGHSLLLDYYIDGISNSIVRVEFQIGGSNFVVGETITIADGFGNDDAVLTVTDLVHGVVQAVSISSGQAGYKYTDGQRIPVLGGLGTGLEVIINDTNDDGVPNGVLLPGGWLEGSGEGYDTGGRILTFNTLVGGTGYTTATGIPTTVISGTGGGALVDIVAVAGEVTEVTIDFGGVVHTPGSVVRIDAGNSDATFTVDTVSAGDDNLATYTEAGAGHYWYTNTDYPSADSTMVMSPFYRVEVDLNTEPIGLDAIVSEEIATNLYNGWEMFRPVHRQAQYDFLYSPFTDFTGAYHELYEAYRGASVTYGTAAYDITSAPTLNYRLTIETEDLVYTSLDTTDPDIQNVLSGVTKDVVYNYNFVTGDSGVSAVQDPNDSDWWYFDFSVLDKTVNLKYGAYTILAVEVVEHGTGNRVALSRCSGIHIPKGVDFMCHYRMSTAAL